MIALSQYAATIKAALWAASCVACIALGYCEADTRWSRKDSQRIANELKAAQKAQEARQTAINAADSKAARQEEKERIVYRTIYRDIHHVKTADCPALSADWLRIHNAAAAGEYTGASDGAASQATASAVE